MTKVETITARICIRNAKRRQQVIDKKLREIKEKKRFAWFLRQKNSSWSYL